MMFPSSLTVAFIAILSTNSIVSHAGAMSYDIDQCSIENKILQNDTELSRLYPRNVSCQESDNYAGCFINYDYVTGVDEYYMRCYELQGRISLIDVVAESCNTTNGEKGTIIWYDPHCLGASCSQNSAYPQLFESGRINELIGLTCPYEMHIYVKTSLSGTCAAEQRTLQKALGPFWLYGSVSRESNLCQDYGGQLFVIASRTAGCERVQENGQKDYQSTSEINTYFCFGASCTLDAVTEEYQLIQDNWRANLLKNYDSCGFSYDQLTAASIIASDSDRNWSFITTIIVALAVAVSVSFM
jgi:hypothetical protein